MSHLVYQPVREVVITQPPAVHYPVPYRPKSLSPGPDSLIRLGAVLGITCIAVLYALGLVLIAARPGPAPLISPVYLFGFMAAWWLLATMTILGRHIVIRFGVI